MNGLVAGHITTNDTMFRQAAAYFASLGGYDDYERPLCHISAATGMIRGIAEILGMDHNELARAIDEARKKSWAERAKAGELMREDGSPAEIGKAATRRRYPASLPAEELKAQQKRRNETKLAKSRRAMAALA